jgi:hypothetical protein
MATAWAGTETSLAAPAATVVVGKGAPQAAHAHGGRAATGQPRSCAAVAGVRSTGLLKSETISLAVSYVRYA